MYKEIGRRVRILRKQRGMTQEQVAEQADISLSFLGHIERGTRKLSVETLVKLSNALKCHPGELLGQTAPGEMNLPLLLSLAADALNRRP